jgi:hypothetical protein
MFPEAPALFSTTIGCPSRLRSASATTRPLVSVTPPGANGTTSGSGLSGYCGVRCQRQRERRDEAPQLRHVFSSGVFRVAIMTKNRYNSVSSRP